MQESRARAMRKSSLATEFAEYSEGAVEKVAQMSPRAILSAILRNYQRVHRAGRPVNSQAGRLRHISGMKLACSHSQDGPYVVPHCQHRQSPVQFKLPGWAIDLQDGG